MAAIKLIKFKGVAPKLSAEILPETSAQTAYNLQVSSGDIIPYRVSAIVDDAVRIGEIKTLHGLYADNGDVEFLSWLTDVDIITASDLSDNDQRIYYTGDGAPKITTFALATTGAEPYPIGFYTLGLPLPIVSPTTIIASFVSSTTSSRARDAGNTATLITASAHLLRTGNLISVRDFTPAPADDWNTTNAVVTVISSTEIQYFNAGVSVSTAADTTGVVELAGLTLSITYTYTWITPFGEESIAAVPSDDLFGKEGQTRTVSGLPTGPPAAPTNNFIRGMRLYRSVSSVSGSAFFKLGDLWFPRSTVTGSLASNIATMEFDDPHNMFKDDRFKISGCTDSDFDIIDGIVLSVVTDRKITYAKTASDIAEKAETTGALFHDVAEKLTDAARYYGDSLATSLRERTSNVSTITTATAHNLETNMVVTVSGMTDATFNETDVTITVTSTTAFTYANTGSNAGSASDTGGAVLNDSFLDTFALTSLVSVLVTDDYDAPDENMIGLVVGQNDVIAGFFDNQLCFAEPGEPHAWPIKYRRTFEHPIVALASSSGFLLVMTEEYAYYVSGTNPAAMSIVRVDTPYPCLSKRSVVNLEFGVIYATHGGMAFWSSRTNLILATEFIHYWDTWNEFLSPSTIVGHLYDDKYFATHSTGAFIFERGQKGDDTFVTIGDTFTAAWTDPRTNFLFFVSDAIGTIKQWDKVGQTLQSMDWKSKTMITKDFVNLGAARVVADFPLDADQTQGILDFNLTVPGLNTTIWAANPQLGTVNGPGFATGGFGTLNAYPMNGDPLMINLKTVVGSYPVQFTLFVNKAEIFSKSVSADAIFRLPTGYRSDTFEVSVSGSARIRAIHLGETPYGLRKV